ncbi:MULTISPECIES: NAD(P)H-dependent glycerol-3-phosphate dehydrogenase [unclassified Massilia]|uniref:NAD(P)H-dependent glycerol-3-phosphate dehydrogenase n=1 Tax=unclassified Massilia TaxID=2609279 RepID=UPI001B815AC4|nr:MULTISPECIES: NAD(P)H-dependent glycerol-3-phosphate dehydrogenase [unclassified Massilia]MBQ5940939.1 NAD(P)-dependent glycerol-3-phosphate dehydrogenase [Massilia sp. AB1]MBQ5964358.1 NAD(P)-dependent glycerol-3-phosphate dehydrogenase [Massilia sp. ZL223]
MQHDKQPSKITILGAGAWGTAVAIALAARHDVLLWGRNPQQMSETEAARENLAYLPGHPLPASLRVGSDFEAALAHVMDARPEEAPLLIAACPVAGLRPLLEQLRGRKIPNVVWLCKGFEANTGLLPHQVMAEVLGDAVPGAALSGPSFAQEVARGLPCALSVASESAELRERVVAAVHGGNLRVYACDDLVGVEVGGAVKNVMAIATGTADGLGMGLNARAALITRGLAEITRLGLALGAQPGTFMGLTGMGDLILTCTGDLSRNRRVGLALAQGKALDTIVAELGHVAEGVPCAKAVRELARRMGVEMPITEAVAGVLFDGVAATEMAQRLLARDPRVELA